MMNGHHLQLYVACIFAITCIIARVQGQLFDDLFGFDEFGLDNNIMQAPNGFHYETMAEIMRNYKPGTYTIMTLGDVLNKLNTPIQNGKNNDNDNDNDNEDDEDDNDQDENEDGDNEQSEPEETNRRKRGFFWNSLPFMSSNDDKTSDGITTTTTSTTLAAKTIDDTTVVDSTAVDVKTITPIEVERFNAIDDMEANTQSILSNIDVMDNAGKELSSEEVEDSNEGTDVNILSIDEDLNISKAVAAPYIPLISKVAIFIIPSISEGQLLMLSINMASITMQAVKNYEQKKSLSTVTTENEPTSVYHALNKRDSNTIGEYASNVYDKLKNMFSSRFKFGSYFQNNNVDDTTIMESDDFNVKETLDKKIYQMKQDNTFNRQSSISKDYNFENDDSGDDEYEGSMEIPEIDKTMFDMYLQESMSSQPAYIQFKTGAELVEFLNRQPIEFTKNDVNINTELMFNYLINHFHYDDEVTNEQKRSLIDNLNKIASFFIGQALKNRPDDKLQIANL